MSMLQIEAHIKGVPLPHERSPNNSSFYYFCYDHHFDPNEFIEKVGITVGRASLMGMLPGWTWHINSEGKPNIRPAYELASKSGSHQSLIPSPAIPHNLPFDIKYAVGAFGWVLEIPMKHSAALNGYIKTYFPGRVLIVQWATLLSKDTGNAQRYAIYTYWDPRNTADLLQNVLTTKTEFDAWKSGVTRLRADDVPFWYLQNVWLALLGHLVNVECLITEFRAEEAAEGAIAQKRNLGRMQEFGAANNNMQMGIPASQRPRLQQLQQPGTGNVRSVAPQPRPQMHPFPAPRAENRDLTQYDGIQHVRTNQIQKQLQFAITANSATPKGGESAVASSYNGPPRAGTPKPAGQEAPNRASVNPSNSTSAQTSRAPLPARKPIPPEAMQRMMSTAALNKHILAGNQKLGVPKSTQPVRPSPLQSMIIAGDQTSSAELTPIVSHARQPLPAPSAAESGLAQIRDTLTDAPKETELTAIELLAQLASQPSTHMAVPIPMIPAKRTAPESSESETKRAKPSEPELGLVLADQTQAVAPTPSAAEENRVIQATEDSDEAGAPMDENDDNDSLFDEPLKNIEEGNNLNKPCEEATITTVEVASKVQVSESSRISTGNLHAGHTQMNEAMPGAPKTSAPKQSQHSAEYSSQLSTFQGAQALAADASLDGNKGETRVSQTTQQMLSDTETSLNFFLDDMDSEESILGPALSTQAAQFAMPSPLPYSQGEPMQALRVSTQPLAETPMPMVSRASISSLALPTQPAQFAMPSPLLYSQSESIQYLPVLTQPIADTTIPRVFSSPVPQMSAPRGQTPQASMQGLGRRASTPRVAKPPGSGPLLSQVLTDPNAAVALVEHFRGGKQGAPSTREAPARSSHFQVVVPAYSPPHGQVFFHENPGRQARARSQAPASPAINQAPKFYSPTQSQLLNNLPLPQAARFRGGTPSHLPIDISRSPVQGSPALVQPLQNAQGPFGAAPAGQRNAQELALDPQLEASQNNPQPAMNSQVQLSQGSAISSAYRTMIDAINGTVHQVFVRQTSGPSATQAFAPKAFAQQGSRVPAQRFQQEIDPRLAQTSFAPQSIQQVAELQNHQRATAAPQLQPESEEAYFISPQIHGTPVFHGPAGGMREPQYPSPQRDTLYTTLPAAHASLPPRPQNVANDKVVANAKQGGANARTNTKQAKTKANTRVNTNTKQANTNSAKQTGGGRKRKASTATPVQPPSTVQISNIDPALLAPAATFTPNPPPSGHSNQHSMRNNHHHPFSTDGNYSPPESEQTYDTLALANQDQNQPQPVFNPFQPLPFPTTIFNPSQYNPSTPHPVKKPRTSTSPPNKNKNSPPPEYEGLITRRFNSCNQCRVEKRNCSVRQKNKFGPCAACKVKKQVCEFDMPDGGILRGDDYVGSSPSSGSEGSGLGSVLSGGANGYGENGHGIDPTDVSLADMDTDGMFHQAIPGLSMQITQDGGMGIGEIPMMQFDARRALGQDIDGFDLGGMGLDKGWNLR